MKRIVRSASRGTEAVAVIDQMTEAMKTGEDELEHGQSYPGHLSPDYDYSIRCSLSCGQRFQR